MKKHSILLIDDEEIILASVGADLEQEDYEVTTVASGERGIRKYWERKHDLVITDLTMEGMDGLQVLREIKQINPEALVIFLTGYGSMESSIEALRLGASDYLLKPCRKDELLSKVSNCLKKPGLNKQGASLVPCRQKVNEKRASSPLDAAVPWVVGVSAAMRNLRDAVENVAASEADVLLVGETGTGKELVARRLHEKSRRRKYHFVAINCCAIPEALMESEVFGHEAGAFTGATRRRIGKFEFAHKGTIYLDEIDSMPLHLQAKLLRTLQERVVERVGSNEPISLDVRIIASTKVDLKEASARGKFREDLFYRLNVVTLYLPALREHLEDIPPLFKHFVLQACCRYQRPAPNIPENMIQNLMNQTWPGNIRELKNAAERLVLGHHEGFYNQQAFPNALSFGNGLPLNKAVTLMERVQSFEKAVIEKELEQTRGSIKTILSALGLPRKTLYDKMQKYGLKRTDYLKGISKN